MRMIRVVLFFVLLFSVFHVFAEDEIGFANDNADVSESTNLESPWELSITSDFAYYFKSDSVVGKTHFAPITGPYGGIAARAVFCAAYKIPTPLGTNFLVKDASVTISPTFELTPITIKPGISITFEPFPFLGFSAGCGAGTGWSLGGIQGIGVMNTINEFDSLVPFRNWYLEAWAKAVFQFDTGAIFPGDWTHVLMQASIVFSFVDVTGIHKGDLWLWQSEINNCSGWRYASSFVLGYQLPFALNMVGILTEVLGQVNPNDYGIYNSNYNGGFAEINISPVLRMEFGDKDTLFIVARIRSRRSFSKSYKSKYEMIDLDYVGREWLFDRIALSWTHTF